MHTRVAIALMMTDDLCNRLASLTMRCRDYGFGLRVLRLPAHVSLKQPFIVPDLERFTTYFDELAARIEPQLLNFDGFAFWGTADQGVVSARVVASPRLHQLHAQLNAELEAAFGGTQAEHDGDGYEFHLTVAIGSSRADKLAQLQADIATWTFDDHTVSSKLAMFIYEESTHPDLLYGVREYGTYRVLPLRVGPNSHL
jgi:2'-5' RNA ligase